MNTALRLILFALLLTLPVATADAANVARLTLLSGESHRVAAVTGISKDRIGYELENGEKRQSDMDDLVGITFEKSPITGSRAPEYVELRLRGGDVVFGKLEVSDDEEISINSQFVGPVRFELDDVREIRFVAAWEGAVDRPAPPSAENEWDVFYYRNLDHVEGTLIGLTRSNAAVQGQGGDRYEISFENLLLVRIADSPDPEAPAGRLAILRLSDGSRLTLVDLQSDGRTVRGTTLRGTKIKLLMADVLALYQTGGRFTYLSDLTPAEVKIVPWIGESYAWDRPRIDRSFLDAPLTCGGETFLKGLGVISGTAMTWELTGDHRLFSARLAVDDTALQEGDVRFEVIVDGESRFMSDVIRRLKSGEEPPRIPPINIAGAKRLTLKVHYVDDFVRDFADWLEPVLIK